MTNPREAQRAQTAKIMGWDLGQETSQIEVLPSETLLVRMDNPSAIQQFVTRGVAVIKLVSQRSGAEHVYRIRKMPNRNFWFVDIAKSDDWGYIGELLYDESYRRGAKCWKCFYEESAVFSWFWGRVRSGTMPAHLEVRKVP